MGISLNAQAGNQPDDVLPRLGEFVPWTAAHGNDDSLSS
jgi:hypothetical protein